MKIQSIQALLGDNSYPGRGILLGRSQDGCHAVTAYFIMGRSENSRNRIFVPTEDGIRTQAHDPSKMTDPSLIIYHPIRQAGRGLIVTNGDQTDTIRDYLLQGRSFVEALRSREFEPDGPNYTPRISGLLSPDGSFQLSILKSADGDPACCCRYHYHYDHPLPGEARLLHTYQGDGDPLPSFQGEPRRAALPAGGAKALADALWAALDSGNKIALFVRYTALSTGETTDVLINRHERPTT